MKTGRRRSEQLFAVLDPLRLRNKAVAARHPLLDFEVGGTGPHHGFLSMVHPSCKAEEPVCHLAVGLIQEALYWVSGGKVFNVEETTCIAVGSPVCTIAIEQTPIAQSLWTLCTFARSSELAAL